jgi:hypothetical protein
LETVVPPDPPLFPRVQKCNAYSQLDSIECTLLLAVNQDGHEHPDDIGFDQVQAPFLVVYTPQNSIPTPLPPPLPPPPHITSVYQL